MSIKELSKLTSQSLSRRAAGRGSSTPQRSSSENRGTGRKGEQLPPHVLTFHLVPFQHGRRLKIYTLEKLNEAVQKFPNENCVEKKLKGNETMYIRSKEKYDDKIMYFRK